MEILRSCQDIHVLSFWVCHKYGHARLTGEAVREWVGTEPVPSVSQGIVGFDMVTQLSWSFLLLLVFIPQYPFIPLGPWPLGLMKYLDHIHPGTTLSPSHIFLWQFLRLSLFLWHWHLRVQQNVVSPQIIIHQKREKYHIDSIDKSWDMDASLWVLCKSAYFVALFSIQLHIPVAPPVSLNSVINLHLTAIWSARWKVEPCHQIVQGALDSGWSEELLFTGKESWS